MLSDPVPDESDALEDESGALLSPEADGALLLSDEAGGVLVSDGALPVLSDAPLSGLGVVSPITSTEGVEAGGLSSGRDAELGASVSDGGGGVTAEAAVFLSDAAGVCADGDSAPEDGETGEADESDPALFCTGDTEGAISAVTPSANFAARGAVAAGA